MMSQHRHWKYIHINLVFYSFLSNLMEYTDIWNSYIIHQNRNVHTLELSYDISEEILVRRIQKISNYAFSLNLLFLLICIFYIFQSCLHFSTISSYHTYVKTQGSKLLAKTKPDAITAACYNCPSASSISLFEVFIWEDGLNNAPKYLWNPYHENETSDNC